MPYMHIYTIIDDHNISHKEFSRIFTTLVLHLDTYLRCAILFMISSIHYLINNSRLLDNTDSVMFRFEGNINIVQ